jgi:hypothetical protein
VVGEDEDEDVVRSSSSLRAAAMFFLVIGFLLAVAIYFAPAMIANYRRHVHQETITVVLSVMFLFGMVSVIIDLPIYISDLPIYPLLQAVMLTAWIAIFIWSFFQSQSASTSYDGGPLPS